MRPGVISEGGAVIEPDLEDGLEAGVAEFVGASGVDEADHRNAAQRGEEFERHGADRRQVTGAAIASAGKVVDGDGNLTRLREGGEGNEQGRKSKFVVCHGAITRLTDDKRRSSVLLWMIIF